MVGPFCFVLHSRLAGISGRNKLLINMKAHLQRCAFCFAFIWFRVQGSGFKALVAASPPFFIGRCPEVVFKSPVTPTIGGKESAHMYGVRSFGSVPTCSGWGFSHIERFRPLRMTIRGERMVSYLRDTLRVLELAVLYTIRVGPWRRKSRRGTSEFGLIQRGA